MSANLAVKRYKEVNNEINQVLKEIEAARKNMNNAKKDPDFIDWGDVGDLQHILHILEEAKQAIPVQYRR